MIDALIAYLKSITINFETIDHAWETEPVEQIRDAIPCLYVFPGDERTEEDGTDYLSSKRVHKDIHVYIVCKREDLDARKTELRSILMGWSSGPEFTDLCIVSGNVISLNGGIVWWQDVYRCAVTVREKYYKPWGIMRAGVDPWGGLP